MPLRSLSVLVLGCVSVALALPVAALARPPHAGGPQGMPGWSGGPGPGPGAMHRPGWANDEESDRERRRQELRRQLSEHRERWGGAKDGQTGPGGPGQPPPMAHPEGRQRLSPEERRALRETLRQDAPRHGWERAPGQR
jgi:hypothetical protein